jgi:glycosyltransferase involved in cell wall biosynthesis
LKINNKNLCFVIQNNYCLRAFLLPHINLLWRRYNVSVVVNDDVNVAKHMLPPQVQVFKVRIKRKVSPFADFLAILALINVFLNVRPDIVHSITPKCGLLSMLAGTLLFSKVRIHTYTGQVWQKKDGWRRYVLKRIDWLIFVLAHRVLCDSHGQRKFLLNEGVIKSSRSEVLLNGSICGVDGTKLVRPTARSPEFEERYCISKGAVVILYMARFTIDKGALVMANAFSMLRKQGVECHLLMVGPDEECLSKTILGICSGFEDQVTLIDYTLEPDEFFLQADIFCLPSFREGLPMVVLNAARASLPIVVSRIYGSIDAVIEDETALVFEPGDYYELTIKLKTLVEDNDTRLRLGLNGENFVHRNFSQDQVVRALANFYDLVLECS